MLDIFFLKNKTSDYHSLKDMKGFSLFEVYGKNKSGETEQINLYVNNTEYVDIYTNRYFREIISIKRIENK